MSSLSERIRLASWLIAVCGMLIEYAMITIYVILEYPR